MGFLFSKPRTSGEPEVKLEGNHVAKQNVTLWSYAQEGKTLVSIQIYQNAVVEVTKTHNTYNTWYCIAHICLQFITKILFKLCQDGPKWWQVRARGPNGISIGYAAKYYFAPKNTILDHEKLPWYFGETNRRESEELLGDAANPDGSFLVRLGSQGTDVLSLKYFNTRNERYEYMQYDVKIGGGMVWFTSRRKFPSLIDLINFCMANKAEGVMTKLTNICLIPNPHADPAFQFYNERHDSLRVPLTEITWDKNEKPLGEGQFGRVFKARFRGNLDVAVKQLKVDNEGEGTKALEEFFKEIATMRGLNHPNLIQLFAYITNKKEGNFMIQEFMAQGDLKNWLQELKRNPERMKKSKKLWSKLLAWCIEVARGMERLESLGIVHRDLAAR